MPERIKYDLAAVQTISFFEQATQARLRDCFEDDQGTLYFIVEPFELGRALGKGAQNVKKLQEKLNKRIKIAEYNADPLQFIANLVYPVKPRQVEMQDGVVLITPPDSSSRSFIIGRNAQNLRSIEKIARRYFEIKEIKVGGSA